MAGRSGKRAKGPSTAALLRAAIDARPETDTRPWSEFAQEFAAQHDLPSVASVQVQISRILRERGAVEPRRPRPRGDRTPPRLSAQVEALMAASGAGTVAAAAAIAEQGREPPADDAVRLAAALNVRAREDATLRRRLERAERALRPRGSAEKGRMNP